MKQVLLIDDSEIDNYINRLIVAKSEIADVVTVFDSAIDALEFLADLVAAGQTFPELIFIDLGMPEMDGFQFLDEYAKFSEEVKEKCSILMLTSSTHPEDIKRASECKYVEHLFNKPMRPEMLANLSDYLQPESINK